MSKLVTNANATARKLFKFQPIELLAGVQANVPPDVRIDPEYETSLEERLKLLVAELLLVYGWSGAKAILGKATKAIPQGTRKADEQRNKQILSDIARHKNKSRAARENEVSRKHVMELMKRQRESIDTFIDSFEDLKAICR